MRKLVPITTALVLALGAPTAILADSGQERGNRGGGNAQGGGGGGGGNQDRGGGGGGGNQERGGGGGKQDRGGGGGNQDRGGGGGGNQARGGGGGNQDRGNGGGGNNNARGNDRSDVRVAVGPNGRVIVAEDGRGNGNGNGRGNDDYRQVRRELEHQTFKTRDGRDVVYFSRDNDRGLISGCPPGLAKKNNGCLPPGQARHLVSDNRYDYLWRGRGDLNRYEYRGGYLYRMDQRGSLLGWLPVLGGALSPGSMWPAQYRYQPAPAYYSSYYGLNPNQDYRYADGALYRVDPQTQMIAGVAALMTGQNLSVGQPLPSGYDIYNVPYDYRDQYVDSADAIYRYNDGYVYQADPVTQLVTAVIQLVT